MIRVEKCSLKDMAVVADIEVTTQEFPLLGPEIKLFLSDIDKEAHTALISNTVTGFTLTTRADQVVTIDSIGTRMRFRNKGVSRKLVDHIVDRAKWIGHKTQMLIPSYLIEDKQDPWSLEEWLWKLGFKAIGETKEGCRRYGRNYGVYIFEKIS